MVSGLTKAIAFYGDIMFSRDVAKYWMETPNICGMMEKFDDFWDQDTLKFANYEKLNPRGVMEENSLINNKDIIIGMLQTLSMKDLSKDTFDDIGHVIIDECHHIGAEVFSRSLPKINSRLNIAYIYGVT